MQEASLPLLFSCGHCETEGVWKTLCKAEWSLGQNKFHTSLLLISPFLNSKVYISFHYFPIFYMYGDLNSSPYTNFHVFAHPLPLHSQPSPVGTDLRASSFVPRQSFLPAYEVFLCYKSNTLIKTHGVDAPPTDDLKRPGMRARCCTRILPPLWV